MEKKSRFKLILIKHALPIFEPSKAARYWVLGSEGKAQSKLLVKRIKHYFPFSLFSSNEPKAIQTAEIISGEFDIKFQTLEGLREINRPVLPLLSEEEFIKLNREIFKNPDEPVIGNESAKKALSRFDTAIDENVEEDLKKRNVVIISHGTVISLFVEKYNSIDAFQLWKNLSCCSFVELEYPGYHLKRVVYENH
jgi:broad specificity phosphatase PhoE